MDALSYNEDKGSIVRYPVQEVSPRTVSTPIDGRDKAARAALLGAYKSAVDAATAGVRSGRDLEVMDRRTDQLRTTLATPATPYSPGAALPSPKATLPQPVEEAAWDGLVSMITFVRSVAALAAEAKSESRAAQAEVHRARSAELMQDFGPRDD